MRNKLKPEWKKLYFSLLVVLLIMELLYLLNRDFLRPMFQSNTFVVMILGSLPNFLASLAAGIIFIPFSVRKLSVADGRLLVYLFSAVCLVLLIQEEISPFIFGSRINDVNDMITSCIGTFCSVIIYEFAFIRTDRVKA